MATNYHANLRTEILRILRAVPGVAIVYPYPVEYEDAGDFPCITIALESSRGDRRNPGSLSEIRENTYGIWIYTRSTASDHAAILVEEIDAEIRAAIETDNKLRTSATNLNDQNFQWSGTDLEGIWSGPDDEERVTAIAQLRLSGRFRRDY